MPYYNKDPKRDHNFDNHPCVYMVGSCYLASLDKALGALVGGVALSRTIMIWIPMKLANY